MKLYYGRISTTDGQTAASQYSDAAAHGVSAQHVHIDHGVSGYHVAPADRAEWRRVEDKLANGGVLVVRWLDRISRRYDELHSTMRRLMDLGVRVECTLNGMSFDGTATDAIAKATRDVVLAFMAAQGEADYLNRREMQRRGIELAKQDLTKYRGRPATYDAQEVAAWKVETGASVRATAVHFGMANSTVSRLLAQVKDAAAAA